MEEETTESKQEEIENNSLEDNTETSDVQAEIVREKETETASHNITETFEDNEEEQESQLGPQKDKLTEDVPLMPSDDVISGPPDTESGPCDVTEEEAETGPLIDETIEDTEEPTGNFIEDEEDLSQKSHVTVEDDKEEDPRLSSSPEELLVPEEEEDCYEDLDMIDKLQKENDRLQEINDQMRIKVADYFNKKQDDKHPKVVKYITDPEQYQNNMDLIKELTLQRQRTLDLHQQLIGELRQQSNEKLNQVESELRSFTLLKTEAVTTAVTGKLDKQVIMEKLNELQKNEQKREDELVSVRLNNIKLKNEVDQLNAALQSQQQLGDGLRWMDFEELKTENRKFKEKFEERNEELIRLRKKIACSVQGITHMKEKISFVKKENFDKRSQLAKADSLVAQKRKTLTHIRQARDKLRVKNLKLQQKCGLLGNTSLLQDFEESVDTSESLQQRLDTLKRRHAELILKCAGVKQKIQQSKPEVK